MNLTILFKLKHIVKNRTDSSFTNLYHSLDWPTLPYSYSNKILLYCDSYHCFDKGKPDTRLYLIKDIKLSYKNLNIIVDDKTVFVILILIIALLI